MDKEEDLIMQEIFHMLVKENYITMEEELRLLELWRRSQIT